MNIIWSDQARRDLCAIRDFIARDSEHYAVLQLERLISRVEQTAVIPSRGHPVHEAVDSDMREVHEGNYRLIYRIQDQCGFGKPLSVQPASSSKVRKLAQSYQ